MKKLLVAMGLAGLLLVPGAAQAQFFVGAQGNWGDDFDFGVGARVGYDIRQAGEPLAIYGTFDWFFPESGAFVDVTFYEFNLNAVYMGGVHPKLDSWIGLGLNVARLETQATSGTTINTNRAGLNLLGGARGKFGAGFGVFGEIRWVIEGSKQLVLTAGLDYTFGQGGGS